MGPSSSLDPLWNINSLCLLPYDVSVNTGAIDRHLAAYFNICVIDQVMKFGAYDLAINEFKLFELCIIGQRHSFHAWDILVFCGCKETVQIHPRVDHLSLMH
jgi:hypothetical protein